VRFSRVPAVTAAFEYMPIAEGATTIGMMQQLVESQADGWTHATDEVRRFYDQLEGRKPPVEPLPTATGDWLARDVPSSVRSLMRGYPGTAETLGRRTAEMHLALAADSTDPAFSPEPFDRADLSALSVDSIGQAGRAFATLERLLSDGSRPAHDGLPPAVATRALSLLRARDSLVERLKSATALPLTAAKIRVHGDYHLGQVLWAEGDFYILDFEGEPARPIDQRRQKQSPLKDVAGMTRSFSYAAYAGLFALTASRPGELERLEGWARFWQAWAAAAFLRGYFTAAAGARFVPADPSQRDALLRLFMLDKALYELNYELNNRPEWVRIPLSGIFDLL
jgi:trehalose synthase-fused probable maltokinase